MGVGGVGGGGGAGAGAGAGEGEGEVEGYKGEIIRIFFSTSLLFNP